ncbi:MAG TPA: hypothetical protein VJ787_05925, partial [Thermoleophilia bacterium]|nr:hypothetical protein [Thermoleophilia bacterium]
SGADISGKPYFTLLGIDATTNGDAYYGHTSVGVYDAEVKLAWTALNGPSIAAVLGFSATADLSLAADTDAFSTYRHAYGWYAQEDALLESYSVEDIEDALSYQSLAVSGHTKTHYVNSHYRALLALANVPRGFVFSRGTGYTAAPPNPYERNKGLECWWRAARQGQRFRIYRDGRPRRYDGPHPDPTPGAGIYQGISTGGSTTSLIDTGRGWAIDPQELVGLLLRILSGANTNVWIGYYITANTANTITIPNALHNASLASRSYSVQEQRYATYVLELDSMPSFAPVEVPGIDRYNLTVPLRRYVAP